MRLKLIPLIPCALGFLLCNPATLAHAQTCGPGETSCWPMAGADLERTSYVSEDIPGVLHPEWYRSIEPYIPEKVNLIAANNTIFASTAKGLYALNATTGASQWIFPTFMPLGNSPTYNNGVIYVAGFDATVYALNAFSGNLIWSSKVAHAGYDTNPLVVNNQVYLGNRDGYLYVLSALDGHLIWSFQTQGPIHFSAAYKDNTIYFASDDSYAYALNASSGQLVWQTRLPVGDGFHSWWPVIDENYIIYTGSSGYRGAGESPDPGLGYTHGNNPELELPGDTNTLLFPKLTANTLDISRMYEFYETKPWRRVMYLLNRTTGQEVTFDIDHDGQSEYAPLYKANVTSSGTFYPPAIGADGKVYLSYRYTLGRGQVAAWQIGSASLTVNLDKTNAYDEPLAYSLGGNTIYWNLCCDREMGAFSSLYNQSPPQNDWQYVSYNQGNLTPGYDIMFSGYHDSMPGINKVYGQGLNGVYGSHGDQNPLIPYNGRVYVHRSNAIIAYSAAGGARSLSLLPVQTTTPGTTSVDINSLKSRLSQEIQKIILADHLRPGYAVLGYFTGVGSRSDAGDHMANYWRNPSDTIITLTQALPFLDATLQQQLKTYLQAEFTAYPPTDIVDVGWQDGAPREAFTLPPEVDAARQGRGASIWGSLYFNGWTYWNNDPSAYKLPPHLFYALWQYAKVMGGAKAIFDYANNNHRLCPLPTDTILTTYPYALNAWIAGYNGYLELQKLAGYPESTNIRSDYNRLLNLRAQTFTKDNPWGGPDAYDYLQTLAISRNFMYLTPELGQYLHDHAISKVQAAINEYQTVAPYWFVTKYEAAFAEQVMQPEYDYQAIFQAKAWILKEPYEELAKYLDVPAFAVGDLFYIQNLIALLNAPSNGSPTATPYPTTSIPLQGDFTGDGIVDYRDFFTFLPHFNQSSFSFNLSGSVFIDIFDVNYLVKILFK